MMNPNDYQKPSNNPSTEEWFQSISNSEKGEGSVLASSAPPDPKKERRKKKVLIAIPVTTLLGSVIVAAAVWVLGPKACLTIADYKELTGTTADIEMSPTDNFYTTSFSSLSKSNTSDSKEIAKIASFYTSHKSNRSIIISLNTSYTDSIEQATTNLSTLQSKLTAAGVDSSALSVAEPTKLSSADIAAENEDSEVIDSLMSTVYLTITSSSDCRQ